MGFEKKMVPLSAIRPSGTNPRDDMGDIDALADAIRATGNEPVNPPVVVRDGNVYRIVDGERRWRALKKIWKLNADTEVPVLVASDMDGAAELVAMLATDDKKPLTDVERGHGVQQMLILGVDEERVARASRATREQISAARAAAPLVPEGAQVTLDQMVAAMGFEGEEDREAVLSAGGDWYAEASLIKRRLAQERRERDVSGLLAELGIPVVGAEEVEGMDLAATVYDFDSVFEARRKMRDLPAQGGEARAVRGADGIRLYVPAGSGGVDREKADMERERGACRDLAARMCHFLLLKWDGRVPPEIEGEARDERTMPYCAPLGDEGLEGEYLEWERSCPVSAYEAGVELFRTAVKASGGFTATWRDEDEIAEAAYHLLDVIDLFRLIGFETDERDAWLVGRARAAADAAEGGDES